MLKQVCDNNVYKLIRAKSLQKFKVGIGRKKLLVKFSKFVCQLNLANILNAVNCRPLNLVIFFAFLNLAELFAC